MQGTGPLLITFIFLLLLCIGQSESMDLEMDDCDSNKPKTNGMCPTHLDRELLAVEEFERTSDFTVDIDLHLD